MKTRHLKLLEERCSLGAKNLQAEKPAKQTELKQTSESGSEAAASLKLKAEQMLKLLEEASGEEKAGCRTIYLFDIDVLYERFYRIVIRLVGLETRAPVDAKRAGQQTSSSGEA